MKISTKTPLKTHSPHSVLKYALAFFMMMLIGGVLAPQKASCEEKPACAPETQQSPQNKKDSSKEKSVEEGNIIVISEMMRSFNLNDAASACKAKDYADKAIEAFKNHTSPVDSSLTEEELQNWMQQAAYIFYYEAYFMHKNLCGAVQNIAQEKEFIGISCDITKTYLKNGIEGRNLCKILHQFETGHISSTTIPKPLREENLKK